MYNFYRNTSHQIIVIGSSRQLGKSFFLATVAIEECIRTPHTIVKFIAPTVKDIKRIITPLIREITGDCPKDMRPGYKSQEHIFRFPNGSEIQLAGTDKGHAESVRGNKSHLCVIDEAGFCDDLKYVVNSILIPTTTTTNGKILMASTPSKAPDHDFMEFMKKAELEGRFIKKTIYDNPRLTKEKIQSIADAIGGVNSVDFRREYMVENIVSEDDAVIPEFNEKLKQEIVKPCIMPPYYDAYVSMDIGVKDLTVVLFAYYDFMAAKLIVQDELVFSGQKMLTDSLAEAIKAKEKALWTSSMGFFKEPTLRVADNNNLVLLNDLQIKHQLMFLPTLKDNADAALNNMRMMLKSGKIIINPACKTLIFHLQSAIWNKARNSYARSADRGHYDAIDTLKYLCRNVNYNKNPYPDNYQFTGAKDIFYVEPQNGQTKVETSLQNMFKIKNPRKLRGY